METQNLISKIQNLISKNRIDEALDSILELNDIEITNEIIILKRRYNDLNSQKIKGILSIDEINLETNKITNSILNVVSSNLGNENKVDLEYEVLLLYNKKDKTFIDKLTRFLIKNEVKFKHYEWISTLDLLNNEEIKIAMKKSNCVAVFFGSTDKPNSFNSNFHVLLNELISFKSNFRIIPVILPKGSEFNLPNSPNSRAYVDFREVITDRTPYQRLLSSIKGIPLVEEEFQLPDKPEPYRGLLSFESSHSKLFFGRENEVSRLLNKLNDEQIIIVSGPSGVGKSSLVKAGLIPKLISKDSNWVVNEVRMEYNPLWSLSRTLASLFGKEKQIETENNIYERLSKYNDGLLSIVSKYLDGNKKSLLIFFDQFEELFSLSLKNKKSQSVLEQFVNNLNSCFHSKNDRFRIIITLRSDFLTNCISLGINERLLESGQFILSKFNVKNFRRAIVNPLRFAGGFFEKGLVDLILKEVKDRSGVLPSLQYLLLELWKERKGPWLTIEAYNNLGGVTGALRIRTENTYQELSPPQKKLTKLIFLRLSYEAEGIGIVKKRVQRTSLAPIGYKMGEVQEILNQFSSQEVRLLIEDREYVELAHDSILKEWTTFKGWLKENYKSRIFHQQLISNASLWELKERNKDYLYRGTRLSEVETWIINNGNKLNQSEYDFLIGSKKLKEQESKQKLLNAIKDAGDAETKRAIEEEKRKIQERLTVQTKKKNKNMLIFSLIVSSLGLLIFFLFFKERTTRKEKERLYIELYQKTDNAKINELENELKDSWLDIDKMNDWLDKAYKFTQPLDRHSKVMDNLVNYHSSISDSSILSGFKFENSDIQSKFDSLYNTDKNLRAFAMSEIGSIERAQKMIAKYISIKNKEHDLEWESKWTRTLNEINTSSSYKNLSLKPDIDLLPLGKDPSSGLQEFAHMLSGDVPNRDDSGKLRITEHSSIILILIPGGNFEMGEDRTDLYDNSGPYKEWPVKKVSLVPYFMSKFQLTQHQFMELAYENVSFYNPARSKDISLLNPVDNVSWEMSIAILSRVGLDLPTEAQWEYAARSNTNSYWWCGDNPNKSKNFGHVADNIEKKKQYHTTVNNYSPNYFGLYGTIGNVWEWCKDPFCSLEVEPEPKTGERKCDNENGMKVYRGGSFFSGIIRSRVTIRRDNLSEFKMSNVGLRACKNLKD